MTARFKFYRVSYMVDGGNSAGFDWFTSRKEADKAAAKAVVDDPVEYDRQPPEIDEVSIVPTKAGILEALRDWAAFADNG